MMADVTRWTLEELVAQVAVALSEVGLDQESGRVTEVPSARTLRYYTTLGLMSPPVAHRGRTALYDERHRLEVVAIKRLQAGGASLEEVQARLVGLGDEALAELAGLPRPGTGRRRTGGRRDGAFWAQPPTEDLGGAGGGGRAEAFEAAIGVRLHPRVRLWIEGGAASLDRADVEAIVAASGPLMAVLRVRGLLEPGQEEDET